MAKFVTALRAALAGGIPLALGRGFSATRELWMAHQLGPTDHLAEYVVASTVFLAIGGLLSGVASALMIREAGGGRSIAPLMIIASALLIVGAAVFSLWPTTRLASPITFWCLVLMLPFFAAYGVANGRLIRDGRVVVGMVAAGVQPVVAFLVMLLPWNELTVAAACGNLVGSIIMATLVFHVAYSTTRRTSFALKKTTVLDGIAILAVSGANIASPIIDRIFAVSIDNPSLVLLNLSTIVFSAVIGTIGIALGNGAVGQSFKSNSHVRVRPALIVGTMAAASTVVLSFIASWYFQGRSDYSSSSGSTIQTLLMVYALATPAALVNQVWIRVWNRHAHVRDMLRLALLLLLLNCLGDYVLLGLFGVVGIAVATLLVQFAQCLYLGIKWRRTGHAVAVISTTIAIGLLMGGVAGA